MLLIRCKVHQSFRVSLSLANTCKLFLNRKRSFSIAFKACANLDSLDPPISGTCPFEFPTSVARELTMDVLRFDEVGPLLDVERVGHIAGLILVSKSAAIL